MVAAKQKRLAPAIDAAMARRVDDAPPLPDGYSFPAMPRRMVDQSGSEEGKKWLERFADDSAAGTRDDSLNNLLNR